MQSKIQQIQTAIRSTAKPLALSFLIGLGVMGAGLYVCYERVQSVRPQSQSEFAIARWREQADQHYFVSIQNLAAGAIGGITAFVVGSMLIPAAAKPLSEAEQREVDKLAAARFLDRALKQGSVKPEQWAELQPLVEGENNG